MYELWYCGPELSADEEVASREEPGATVVLGLRPDANHEEVALREEPSTMLVLGLRPDAEGSQEKR